MRTSIVRHFIDSPTARHARDSRTCWRVPAISGKPSCPSPRTCISHPAAGPITPPPPTALGNPPPQPPPTTTNQPATAPTAPPPPFLCPTTPSHPPPPPG